MRTIAEAAAERESRIKADKKLKADEQRERVYREYPELRKIDARLIDIRTSRMICSIDHDDEPVPALLKAERDVLTERKSFLSDHGIDEEFDREKIVCGKCSDTGFAKARDGRKVVCRSCMKDELESVFNESGLTDFKTFTIKSFDLDYYDDEGLRKRRFKAIRDLIEGENNKNLMLLSGGTQTGKTYLAVISCKYAILQGLSAFYVKADRISFLPDPDLNAVKGYDFIVIDDYAAEVTNLHRTAYALHTLLEARLASGKATLIVSNASLGELVSDSEERIAGKLRGAASV